MAVLPLAAHRNHPEALRPDARATFWPSSTGISGVGPQHQNCRGSWAESHAQGSQARSCSKSPVLSKVE